MSTKDEYEWVYTGSEVNVQHLQRLFEEKGISSRQKNDFESGLRAGFGGGVPGQVQLFALNSQREEALKIVQDTFPENQNEI